ncbi:hypothetical protein [Amycolatopsis sp. SID8362]|uniref:hypothetical protein n=1 Tax=Amycolatopsis sp. SID8362 TaxID=2690346 RepID=UPI00136F7BB8|nr:hypothetical protein [Amycolatopsis sp. SID8362]NBH02580.1 hypothetical protein [Amycolatopsis sp. SID8362]NED39282.1 hypothetical protein [Amycolatopsis sp. SID8362]
MPEVDDVCRSAPVRGDLIGALAKLGRARAHTGAGLDETLQDVAALHAVLERGSDPDGLISADPDAVPPAMLRAAEAGWADVATTASETATTEPLTGLATEEYLRARLVEVYRQAARGKGDVAPTRVLLVIGIDLSRVARRYRPMAMVLVADVVRTVFDDGETAAVLDWSTAVVLAEQDADLGCRIRCVRRQIADRLSGDPQLAVAAHTEIRLHRLPDTWAGAHDLLRIVGQGEVPRCRRR